MDNPTGYRFFKRNGLFIALMLIGITFRLLFMYYQGLSNDELSAWNRTRFDTWIDFWHHGVKAGDMHPVFYQALLWISVRIFGDSEIALRAPSLLFYLLNSWIIYQLGIRFFSKKAGLLVIAIYAGLGFTIINTVFTRPYNSGTFFVLLLVWSLLEIAVSKRKISGWHLGIFVGFLGAMLSHYFAFLTAGVIGACALFYLPKRRILELLLIGFLAILAFLPHLPITLFQLNQGGLGWLPPPTWNWLGLFFIQFFNNSWILLSLFVACLLIAWFRGSKWVSKEEKFLFQIVLFTYLVGHFISVFYTPVLRELVMLFTLPFLLMLVFSRFQEQLSTRISIGIVAITVGIGIHSIAVFKVLQPVHFGIFREIGQVVNEADESIGRENMAFASNFCNVDYINYYYKRDVKESITDWMNSETVYTLNDRAKQANQSHFVYNWSNNFHMPIYYEAIRQHFPYVQLHTDYFNGAATIFSKNSQDASSGLQKRPILKSKTHSNQLKMDSTEFLGNQKWNAFELKSILKNDGYLLVEMTGKLTKDAPCYLVATLERNGVMEMMDEQPMLYVAFDQHRFFGKDSANTWYAAFDLPKKVESDAVIHFYIWNPTKQQITFGEPKLFEVFTPKR